MAWELHSQTYSWAHAVISMTESRLFLIVPRAQRFLQILFVEIVRSATLVQNHQHFMFVVRSTFEIQWQSERTVFHAEPWTQILN